MSDLERTPEWVSQAVGRRTPELGLTGSRSASRRRRGSPTQAAGRPRRGSPTQAAGGPRHTAHRNRPSPETCAEGGDGGHRAETVAQRDGAPGNGGVTRAIACTASHQARTLYPLEPRRPHPRARRSTTAPLRGSAPPACAHPLIPGPKWCVPGSTELRFVDSGV